MKLLITRAEPQASAFAAMVAARGHETVIAPLFSVRFSAGADLDVRDYAAILLGSANGARALARRLRRRDVRILAVGPQTAAAAEAEGFMRVETAGGDSKALLAALPALVPPGAKLLQATAANGRAYGHPDYVIDRMELYETAAAEFLSDAAAAALRSGSLDGAFFFSPHSAEIFRDRVTSAGLGEPCARLDALCISAATGEALPPLRFARVRIAAAPNRAAMLNLLP